MNPYKLIVDLIDDYVHDNEVTPYTKTVIMDNVHDYFGYTYSDIVDDDKPKVYSVFTDNGNCTLAIVTSRNQAYERACGTLSVSPALGVVIATPYSDDKVPFDYLINLAVSIASGVVSSIQHLGPRYAIEDLICGTLEAIFAYLYEEFHLDISEMSIDEFRKLMGNHTTDEIVDLISDEDVIPDKDKIIARLFDTLKKDIEHYGLYGNRVNRRDISLPILTGTHARYTMHSITTQLNENGGGNRPDMKAVFDMLNKLSNDQMNDCETVYPEFSAFINDENNIKCIREVASKITGDDKFDVDKYIKIITELVDNGYAPSDDLLYMIRADRAIRTSISKLGETIIARKDNGYHDDMMILRFTLEFAKFSHSLSKMLDDEYLPVSVNNKDVCHYLAGIIRLNTFRDCGGKMDDEDLDRVRLIMFDAVDQASHLIHIHKTKGIEYISTGSILALNDFYREALKALIGTASFSRDNLNLKEGETMPDSLPSLIEQTPELRANVVHLLFELSNVLKAKLEVNCNSEEGRKEAASEIDNVFASMLLSIFIVSASQNDPELKKRIMVPADSDLDAVTSNIEESAIVFGDILSGKDFKMEDVTGPDDPYLSEYDIEHIRSCMLDICNMSKSVKGNADMEKLIQERIDLRKELNPVTTESSTPGIPEDTKRFLDSIFGDNNG